MSSTSFRIFLSSSNDWVRSNTRFASATMHVSFGIICVAVVASLVGVGTHAEQFMSACSLGCEVPTTRYLRSDTLINDNDDERMDRTGLLEDIVNFVGHNRGEKAITMVEEFLAPDYEIKGLLDIVHPVLVLKGMKKIDNKWLGENVNPKDVFNMLRISKEKDKLFTETTTFRWIEYVNSYNANNKLTRSLLEDFKEAGHFTDEFLLTAVFLPNIEGAMMKEIEHFLKVSTLPISKEAAEKALQVIQFHAVTRLKGDFIKSWMNPNIGEHTVCNRLGLSPTTPETGFDFSRFEAFVKYKQALSAPPIKVPSHIPGFPWLNRWGYTLSDLKILHKNSDKTIELSTLLDYWIHQKETSQPTLGQ